ncbi:hypothetical protein TVAG_416170 [Trichomonas vaginalis G3]|uniref:Uncharacterized protein n=1 Tax=Trichomonas vaginalis (strain ATCC PRA-98 / G3) TaxID=412133 RepID=A2FQ48_TRIV3|nr:translation proteins sh3-like domain family [Trichomonas vaginalis G3]EAX92955.1 hypothetical protein TVAG_416170 [Trichomonas vaginalis G3]KAI5512344.1 translation proteins sh3-like domain family [Trichomonas vaginalis G3]|eukprot:XP_001305885.1 hypothetical protein [Trichomonas vaginalis G3]
MEGKEENLETQPDLNKYISNLLVTGDKITEKRTQKLSLFEEQNQIFIAKVKVEGDASAYILKNFEEFSTKKSILSFLSFPFYKDCVFFETNDKEQFEIDFSKNPFEYVDKDWFNQRFCNFPESHYIDIKDRVYGKYTNPPYDEDTCEVLCFSPDLKRAIIRILPRLSIPSLNITPDKQMPLDVKFLRKNKIKYLNAEVPTSFDSMYSCNGMIFQDSYFVNPTAIMKVDASTLKIYGRFDLEEIKKLEPPLRPHLSKFTEPKKPAPFRAGEHLARQKKEKEKKEKLANDEANDTENKEETENDEKVDAPIPQIAETMNENSESENNEEKPQKQSHKSRKRKKSDKVANSTSSSQKSKPKSDHTEKKTSGTKIQQKVYQEIMNTIETPFNCSVLQQKERAKSDIALPYEIRFNHEYKTITPELYSLVELPTNEFAVVTNVDSEKELINCLLFINRTVAVPTDCELPLSKDDNTVHDRRGLRVFPGDVVQIQCGDYKGFMGTVTHTKCNRVFALFSAGGNTSGIHLFASGREIDLIEDDMGPIDV